MSCVHVQSTMYVHMYTHTHSGMCTCTHTQCRYMQVVKCYAYTRTQVHTYTYMYTPSRWSNAIHTCTLSVQGRQASRQTDRQYAKSPTLGLCLWICFYVAVVPIHKHPLKKENLVDRHNMKKYARQQYLG